MNDDEILEELGRTLGHDPSRTPPPDRVAALRTAAERMQPQHRAGPGLGDAPRERSDNMVPIRNRGGRRLFLAGGIAAGVGGIAGYVGRDLKAVEIGQTEASVEEISFATPDGVTAKAGLINHTWGTELMLDVSGLDAGTTYDVVYRTTDGSKVKAGSMLAVAEVTMKCRFNAAALRADVRAIEVRDGKSLTLESTLPTREV